MSVLRDITIRFSSCSRLDWRSALALRFAWALTIAACSGFGSLQAQTSIEIEIAELPSLRQDAGSLETTQEGIAPLPSFESLQFDSDSIVADYEPTPLTEKARQWLTETLPVPAEVLEADASVFEANYPLNLVQQSGVRKVGFNHSISVIPLGVFAKNDQRDSKSVLHFTKQLKNKSISRDIHNIQKSAIFFRPKVATLSLNDVLARALAQSSQIAEFQFDALEFQQVAGQALGEFDPVAFVQSSFGQGNEPVATNFQVNNAAQTNILSQDLQIQSGIRRRTKTGGQLSLRNTMQLFDDDSGVLQPPDQAISRFALNFSQELMRDSGRKVVLNRVLVANVLAQGETANTLAKVTNQLNDVAAAYWNLFINRGKVLISREQVEIAKELVQKIENRAEFDSEKNLLFQARSSLLQQEVELQQATARAKQAQDFLCRLIGDPTLMDPSLEVVTVENPVMEQMPVHLESEIALAFANRPEVQQAIANIKAARLTHHFTLNQLLPRLTFDVQASLNGLAGDRDLGQAISNKIDTPTYAVGLNLEVPINNLTAKFRDREAEIAASRVAAEFRNTLDEIQLEVKLAARRLNYVGGSIYNLNQVIGNTYNELGIILDRTLVAPRRDDIPSVQLNLLLDAQTRLNDAKLEFLESVLEQQQSLIELKKSTGTLYSGDILYADRGPSQYNKKQLRQALRFENQAYRPEIENVQQKIFHQNANFGGTPTIHSHVADSELLSQPKGSNPVASDVCPEEMPVVPTPHSTHLPPSSTSILQRPVYPLGK